MLLRKSGMRVSTALVVLVVILALLLVGARLVGLQVFTVLLWLHGADLSHRL